MTLLQLIKNFTIDKINIWSSGYCYPDFVPCIIDNYSIEKQIEALINIFYCARYFELDNLQAIFKECESNNFAKIKNIIIESNAHQDNWQIFNGLYLYESLHEVLSEQEIKDIFLNMLNKAYLRHNNMERNKIPRLGWVYKYYDFYLKNLAILGMTSSLPPQRDKYHESWVLGANELLMDLRLLDLKQSHEKNVDIGEVFILAGKRELCAGLDNPGYIMELARNLDIDFDQTKPWILGEDGQLYLNYTNPNKKLYETDLAQNKAKKYFPDQIIQVIDSKKYDNWRPTTNSTAEDAFSLLMQKINNKHYQDNEIYIRIQSNQPFAQRQILSFTNLHKKHENYLNDIGVKINFEVTAPALTQQTIDCYGNSLAYIHSELAGLIFARLK